MAQAHSPALSVLVERAKKLVGKVAKEQPDRKFVAKLVDIDRIVSVVE